LVILVSIRRKNTAYSTNEVLFHLAISRSKMNFMDTKISTKNGTLTIRPAREADAPAFHALRLEALKGHPTAFSADYEINAARPVSYWEKRLHKLGEGGMIYFATDQDGLVGTCGIHRGESSKTRHSALVWGVYVRPAWRGLGIADALIDACLAWGHAHEVTVAKLSVSTNNMAAIRCYTRCGFTVYGVEPSALYYDSVMYDELLMARLL
jgi:RimJ/RimL family protein N-acetyltransferase